MVRCMQYEWIGFSQTATDGRTILIRLPATMITNPKVPARKRDVPYQSLLKIFLADRLKQEMRTGR
jgi:hypothetical protein